MKEKLTQNMSARKSILVVDDHELLLRGIYHILKQSFPEAEILTADTGENAVKTLGGQNLDLVTVDLELPDMSGFNLIDYIRLNQPNAKILVNTVHDEIWTVKRLAERRVEGVVFKSAQAQDFVEAVSRLLAGETYYSSGAQLLMKSISTQNAEEMSLSIREVEVLRLIAYGYNTEEIGARLGVKPNTVETHRRHLLEKLQVRNSAELVRRAMSSGILSSME